MLNVGKIENGIVLDHIQAGKSMLIYHYLELNKLDCTVAIIKNARSNAMGKKDILKIETDAHSIDLDVIAFIDPDVTVNIIKGGELVEKKSISLPKEVKNVIKCTNPRCITSIEQGVISPIQGAKSTAAATATKNTPSRKSSGKTSQTVGKTFFQQAEKPFEQAAKPF